MKRLLVALSLSLAAIAAHADAVDTLKDFIRDVKTGRAQFTQTVTSPDGAFCVYELMPACLRRSRSSLTLAWSLSAATCSTNFWPDSAATLDAPGGLAVLPSRMANLFSKQQ